MVTISKDGCIACLAIPEELGNKIVVDGYETLDSLHITLAKVILDDDINNKKIRYDIVSSALKVGNPPNIGFIKGLNRFYGVNDGSVDAIVALIDIIDLYDWQKDFIDVLNQNGVEVAKNYKFKPHITLAYVDMEEECDIYIDKSIVNVYINFGNLEIRDSGAVFIP